MKNISKYVGIVVGFSFLAVVISFCGIKIDRWYTTNILLKNDLQGGQITTQLANMGWSVTTTYFDTSSTSTTLVAPARQARYYWLLQNLSSNTQSINFGPTSTAIVNQVPELLAHGSYDSNQINNYPGPISMASSSNPGRMIFIEAYKK